MNIKIDATAEYEAPKFVFIKANAKLLRRSIDEELWKQYCNPKIKDVEVKQL